MKSKKSVILLISILFPLIITAYVGMYMYGVVGTWKNNQEKFNDKLINPNVETVKGMDTYLKLNHKSYIYNIDNFKLYTGTFAEKEEVTKRNDFNGTYDLNGYSITSVSATNTTVDSDAVHSFYITNVNYGNVLPSNVVVLAVKYDLEDVEGSYELLTKAYEQFTEKFQNNSDKLNAATSSTAGFYDKNAIKAEDDKNEGTPYAIDILVRRDYPLYKVDEDGNAETDSSGNKVLESQTDLSKLNNILYAFVETFEDNSSKLLCFGELTNIVSKSTEISKAYNAVNGYFVSNNELKTLENAGYLKFIWPTILWQTAIAFVAAGLLAFFFYRTWTADDNTKNESKDLKSKKKNVNNNRFISFLSSVFGKNDWLTCIVTALIALFVLIQFNDLDIISKIAEDHFTLLIVTLCLFGLALVGFIYLCLTNLKKSNKRFIDQTIFALDIVTVGLLIMYIVEKFKNPEPYMFYTWIVLGVVAITLTTLRIMYKPLNENAPTVTAQNITNNNYYQSIFKRFGLIVPITSVVLLYALIICCDLFGIFGLINNASRAWLVFDFTVLISLAIFLTITALQNVKNENLSALDLFLFIIDVVTLALGITFVILGGHVAKFIIWLVILVLAATITSMRIQFITKNNKK